MTLYLITPTEVVIYRTHIFNHTNKLVLPAQSTRVRLGHQAGRILLSETRSSSDREENRNSRRVYLSSYLLTALTSPFDRTMGVQSKEAVPPWGLAVAGATGAVLANALVYPLDMYEALFLAKGVQAANLLAVSKRVCKSK